MSVSIHYNLDILAANMSSQGCDVDRLHKKIQFHAQTESTPSRRRCLKIQQRAQDENHGMLGFDMAELLQCMDDAAMPRVDSNDQRDMQAMAACDFERRVTDEESGTEKTATENIQSYPFSLMNALLTMYSNPRKYLFVRLLFSIRGQRAFSNNFACILTFVRQDDQVKLQPVWNGSWWEDMTHNGQAGGENFFFRNGPGTAFIPVLQPEADLDPVFEVAMRSFVHRSVMIDEVALVAPFLTPGRRNRGMAPAHQPEMVENFNGLTYVQPCMAHFFISHMHALLAQRYPANLVLHVLQTMADTNLPLVLQQQSRSDSDDDVLKADLFMVILVKIVVGLEGAYRPDVNGEDIGTRFDLVRVQKKSHSAPLLAGGDCEDMAQAVISMLVSIRQVEAGQFPWLDGFLHPPKALQWECMVARGTCLQGANEENHTFVVSLHRTAHGHRLHVVETVGAQFVVSDDTPPAAVERLKMFAPGVEITRASSAAVTYQHVLILDHFLVLEFRASRLHLGAATFETYAQVFRVADCDDASTLKGFLHECKTTLPTQRLLLLITREAFLTYYPRLFALSGSQAVKVTNDDDTKLIPSTNVEKRKDAFIETHGKVARKDPPRLPLSDAKWSAMQVYARFSVLFINNYLVPFFQEDTQENAAWVDQYFTWHPQQPPVVDAANFFWQARRGRAAGVVRGAQAQVWQGGHDGRPSVVFRPPSKQRQLLEQAAAALDHVIQHFARCMLTTVHGGAVLAPTCFSCCSQQEMCTVHMVVHMLHAVKLGQCGISRTFIQPLSEDVQNLMVEFAHQPASYTLFRLYDALLQLRANVGFLLASAPGLQSRR